jgi:hypothetical protein
MNILFDQGTPVPLRKYLKEHNVENVFDRGWNQLANGELIKIAEKEGFDVFVTTDKNLKYQQNLSSRVITIILLSTTSWPKIKEKTDEIALTISKVKLGSYIDFEV